MVALIKTNRGNWELIGSMGVWQERVEKPPKLFMNGVSFRGGLH